MVTGNSSNLRSSRLRNKVDHRKSRAASAGRDYREHFARVEDCRDFAVLNFEGPLEVGHV